ncbi:hypothetical protein N7455_010824 [Penicillium solitum]|uniref:uncharacterized protein n=1 Tax=Penicillium solitum TaxID=60172 RepID=UPI0017D41339|nr:hypothetical protein HAV15_000949 [Penicillium sp. str. \
MTLPVMLSTGGRSSKLTGGLYHGKKKPYLFQSERQQKASKGLWYSWAIVAHATPMAYFMNHGEMDAYGLRKYHVAELVVGTILGNPTLFFAHMRFPDEVTKRMVLKPQDVLERYVYEPDQLPIKDINNPTEKYQSLAISSLGLEEW